jgi:uncharacterized membrane protein
MELNGLPLHPLAVHAAVVLAPLAAVLAIAYVVPAWSDRLRWPLLVGALAAAGAVVLAYFSGESFREANAFFNDPALPTTEQIDEHETHGTRLMWATAAFAVVAVLSVLLHDRPGWLRSLVLALLVGTAVVVGILVYLTGDAGARAVWGEGFSG